MTTPTPTDDREVVQVTQADREAAAANWLNRVKAAHGDHAQWMDGVCSDIRAGVCDDAPEVQAFARHRLTAVNHHQALVDALREARKCLGLSIQSFPGAERRIDTLLSQIGEA